MSKFQILNRNWHDSKIASFADHNLNYSTTEYTDVMFLASLKAYVLYMRRKNIQYDENWTENILKAQIQTTWKHNTLFTFVIIYSHPLIPSSHHSQMKRLLNWANLYSTCLFFLPTPLPEIFRWHMFWVEKTQDSPRCCYETHYDKSPLISDCFKSQLCVECQHNAGDNLWKWVLFSAHISKIALLTDVEKNHP